MAPSRLLRVRLRPLGLGLLASLLAAAAVALVPAPGRADTAEPPGPTAGLIALLSPSLMDPLITALPPLPTRYQPSTSPICPDGDPQCIVEVISEMKDRLAPLAASCSHDAIFSLAYLRVTENVKAAADAGYFHDRAWLTRLDAIFAQMYFDTMDAWNAGRIREVPPAWRIALQATRDRTMTGLGDFLLNMNAHINNDFAHALVADGLTAPDGSSHKADHNAYNDRLDSLYHPVFAEETARFDPTFDAYDVGPFDEMLVGAIMRGWREAVWRNAEALAHAPNPLARSLVEHEIVAYSTSQARLIRKFFSSPDPTARDAYCALHHG